MPSSPLSPVVTLHVHPSVIAPTPTDSRPPVIQPLCTNDNIELHLETCPSISRWRFCLPPKASISTITTQPNGLCTWAGEPVGTGARTLTVKLGATLPKNACLSSKISRQ